MKGKTMKSEVTGKRAPAIAGKVLGKLKEYPSAVRVWIEVPCPSAETDTLGFTMFHLMPIAELKTLAASLLTQAPDRAKKKR